MKKIILLMIALSLVLVFSSAALADHDIDIPWTDPECRSCHGPIDGPPPFDPPAMTSQPSSQTLRNTIRFDNLYALSVLKVEQEFLSPLLDLGSAGPTSQASGHFWTRVYSNAPYNETFVWGDFQNAANTIPADRMTIDISNDGVTSWNLPSGTVHGPHSSTAHAAWEKITVNVRPQWTDAPGVDYENTLDIIVTQL